MILFDRFKPIPHPLFFVLKPGLNIFDLFFLGNSKIAKSYLENDLIFYNCEHPIWKYDIECHESDTLKISSEFCKSIIGD